MHSDVSTMDEITANAQAAVTAVDYIVYSADFDVTYESDNTEITKRVYPEPVAEADDPTA